MSKPSVLDFHYNLSKRTFLREPTRMFTRERQNSRSLPVCQPSLNDLKKVFDRFDANKDGEISPEEYKGDTQSHREEKPPQKIFNVAHADGDGFIGFKEFVEVQKKEGGINTMDLQSAFHAFDKDGQVYELRKGLGQRCSLQDCRKMVKEVDANGDGVIDLNEFVTMMTRTMTLC
ncbi:unnamed protein product [Withania somnifera]